MGDKRRQPPLKAVPTVAQTGLTLEALLDRLLDAVVIANLATGRIVVWNRAASDLFGYSAAEAIGQSIEILMPAPVAQVHRAGFARYQRTGHGLIIDASEPVEMPARHRDGQDIRVEMTLSLQHNPAGERFAVAVMRATLRGKQQELARAELAQARAARAEAEAALAALVAGHELQPSHAP